MAIIKTKEIYNYDNGKLKANAGDWTDGTIDFSQRGVVSSEIGNICSHETPMSGIDQFTFSNFDWQSGGYSVGDALNGSVEIETWAETFFAGGAGWIAGTRSTITLTFNVDIAAIIGSTTTLTGAPYNLSNPGFPFATTSNDPTLMPGTIRIIPATPTTRIVYEYFNATLENTSRPDEVDFKFNLARNNTTTESSLIDGEINKFTLDNVLALSTGVPTLMTQSNNKSGGYFKDVKLEKLANNGDFSTEFRITFRFFQWGIIEDGLPEPSYYGAGDQIEPVAHIGTINANGGGDILINTTASIDKTGGYNEVYNGGVYPFIVQSTQWFDSLGNPILGMDFSGISTFKSVIDTGGNQGVNHRYRIGLTWRPEDSTVFQNKQDNLGKNLLINAPTLDYAPSTTPSAIVHGGESDSSGAKLDISELLFEIVGSTLEVSGKVTPNAAYNTLFSAIPDGGRKSTLWISLGSTPFDPGGGFVMPQKDRVSLKLYDQDNIDAPIVGVQISDIVEEVLLDHGGNNVSNATTANTTTEDDMLYKSSFLLTDNVVYSGLRCTISAYNTVNGSEFELESNYISFANVVNINGQYQPNILQPRAFNLPPTTDRNHYSVKRDVSLDVAGKYGIELQYGFLNDWRYWLNQSNVHNDFFSISPNANPIPPGTPLIQDFDGKSKNWQKFYDGDWLLRVNYFLDREGVEDFNHKEYKIRPYEDDIDVTMTELIVLVSTGATLTTFAANSLHEVTTVFTWDQNFDDEWVEFTIEDFEGGNRWVMSSLLDQGNVSANPLKPITGVTKVDVSGTGTNVLTCKALVDTNLVNASEIAVSYRVYSAPNETIPFLFTVDTNNTGSASDTFILPLHMGTTNFTVFWGDGTSDVIASYNQSELSHVYTLPGIYQVFLFGDFTGVNFNNTGDKLKIISIDQWGGNHFTEMINSFYGCSNMTGNFVDFPNTSGVTNTSFMFALCSSFNHPITFDTSSVLSMGSMFNSATSFNQVLTFDTSSVTNMVNMFRNASSYNQVLTFDTSSVVDMASMFLGAEAYNQVLTFDTSSVTNMASMFRGCIVYDQILTLNTSIVINMSEMFLGCTAYNQVLTLNTSNVNNMSLMFQLCTNYNQVLTFDTSSVTNMTRMFNICAFNHPLTFDTSNVTNMSNMFQQSPAFDQDIGGFNISSLTSALDMFFLAGLSTSNYNSLLVGWEGQPHNNNVPFNGGNSTYTLLSAADTAKSILVGTDLWTIIDGGGI